MKTLEDKILARVRRMYLVRKFFAPTALKAYSLGLCVMMLGYFVSIVHVVANMPSLTTPGALTFFIVNALTHTEIVVQILFAVACVAILMLVRDFIRGVEGQNTHLAHV
ncbi:MAG: hypothetical protein KBD24_02750 [Candidatus Pacebacteria bacterium]|nr:hypothetical protein [Candidatus Paceibacterota bacterium]